MLFSVPALLYNWRIIWFVLSIMLLSFISIYYSKKKDERALLNDLNTILIFAIAGMAAYYFSENQFDERVLQVAVYLGLFFIVTTL